MELQTNLESYRIFYQVAKEKNITRASEKLFISQPAVSQSIKKLEESLGVVLFVRNKKGISLTAVGEEILRKVEIAMANFAAVEEIVDKEKGLLKGQLTIGAGSTLARQILAQPISRFCQDFPLVQISQVEGVQTEMVDKLKKGEVNIIITQKNDNFNLDFLPLFESSFCFVKKAGCENNNLICTSKGSFTRVLLDQFVEKNNLTNNKILQVSGHKMSIDLCLLGTGITLVPEYIALPYIENGELVRVFKDYTFPKIEYGAYYNADLLTPATEMFLKYLQ